MADFRADLAPGTLFRGTYEVVRRIAGGGMGAVYECVHRVTRGRSALKLMHPQIVAEPLYRARFELEARVTAEIESDYIVKTLDAGVDDATGAPFLVMELLKGEDLGAALKRRGRLPADEVVTFLAQTARALDKTHAAGIVHRDLKPDNLFLTTREDGSPCVKILDFGIAKVVSQGASAGGATVIGTPLYMSPEQVGADGAIGPAADVYALGQIAFALLTGAAYWVDEERSVPSVFALLIKVLSGPPEAPVQRAARRRVQLPPAFDAWFLRATAREPSARFAPASKAIEALGEALDVAPPRPSMSSGSGKPLGRKPMPKVTDQMPVMSEPHAAAPRSQLDPAVSARSQQIAPAWSDDSEATRARPSYPHSMTPLALGSWPTTPIGPLGGPRPAPTLRDMRAVPESRSGVTGPAASPYDGTQSQRGRVVMAAVPDVPFAAPPASSGAAPSAGGGKVIAVALVGAAALVGVLVLVLGGGDAPARRATNKPAPTAAAASQPRVQVGARDDGAAAAAKPPPSASTSADDDTSVSGELLVRPAGAPPPPAPPPPGSAPPPRPAPPPAPAPTAAGRAAPRPSSAASGCSMDTECKGDRICVDHRCVMPR